MRRTNTRPGLGSQIAGWLLAAAAGVAAPACAQEASNHSGTAADGLLACRTIAAPSDRLACFDRQSEIVDGAIRRHDLALIDRSDVERKRRTMFGLSSPDHKILEQAAGRSAAIPLNHDGVIQSVSAASFGHYTITLADGAVWRNVDLLDASPSVGAAVHIDRTPFGAYLLKMPNFLSVHAVRLR